MALHCDGGNETRASVKGRFREMRSFPMKATRAELRDVSKRSRSKMKVAFAAPVLVLFLCGCSTTGVIKGRFLDAEGRGIPEAEVIFWRGRSSAPLLATLITSVKTDADGRFAAIPGKPVHFVTVRKGREYRGSADVPWRSRKELVIRVQVNPYRGPDYSDLNVQRLPSERDIVRVTITGPVQRPGVYTFTRNDNVWSAFDAAGGLRTGIVGDWAWISREQADGTRLVFPVDWKQQKKDIVAPLLADGDILSVNSLPEAQIRKSCEPDEQTESRGLEDMQPRT
jgi:hypothetical protein